MVNRPARYSMPLILGLVFSTNYVCAAQPNALPTEPHVQGANSIHGEYAADSAAPIEIVQERYPSGKVRIRREVTQDSFGNYILHGEWQMWNIQGNEIAFGHYKNNKRHGDWRRVHLQQDSKLFSIMPYKEFQAPFTSQASFQNGQLHGKWIFLDSQQRKISQWEYSKGLLHGVATWYYPNGNVLEEAVYRDGFMDGYNRSYDKESNLIIDDTYQQGRKLAPKVELYDSGQTKSEGMYLHAQFVIDRAEDWWNAKPVTYKPAGQDQRHGRWTSWFPNGQKKFEGMYEKDIREGQFAWWYPNSQQALTGAYKAGLPHGLWVWSHKNGQNATKGKYVDGQFSGTWYYWTEDGLLSQKIDYEEDPQPVLAQSEEEKEVATSKTLAPNNSAEKTFDR